MEATGGGVYFHNSIPGKFVVPWKNVDEWAAGTPTFTMQAQLFANGDVTFDYSTNHTGITVGYGSQFLPSNGVVRACGLAAILGEVACILMALVRAPALLQRSAPRAAAPATAGQAGGASA